MVQDAQRIAEVHRRLGQRHGGDVGMMKLAVVVAAKRTARDGERGFAGVHAMQASDSCGDQARPAPAAAAEIEALGLRWQLVPGKHREILREQRARLGVVQGGLIEARPFATKPVDGVAIDIFDRGGSRTARRLGHARHSRFYSVREMISFMISDEPPAMRLTRCPAQARAIGYSHI